LRITAKFITAKIITAKNQGARPYEALAPSLHQLEADEKLVDASKTAQVAAGELELHGSSAYGRETARTRLRLFQRGPATLT
jgi:hypothetical protein